MKRNTIVLVIILALATSCEDILDLTPLDALTAEQAFVTEQNLKMYVNSLYELALTHPSSGLIYGTVANEGYNKWSFTGDVMTDLTTNGNYCEEYIIPGAYRADLEEFWTWDELRRINYFLENYQRSEAPANVKNNYAGIARCFRAKFYYDKVIRFGDVPWYSKTVGSSDEALYKGRDPRTLVMDSVLADLNFAINNITDVKDNTATTFTKWVALGYKARICLFEGTFRKYHPEIGLAGTANIWLQHAADAANEIMTSGKYSIYSTGKPEKDYHDLFISDDAINAEIMLCNAHSEATLNFNNTTNFFSNEGGRYMTALNKRFINTYLNIDGSRFTEIPGYDSIFFTREVKNRDLRLSQTIRNPSYKRTDGTCPPPYGAFAPTFYHPIKWSHPDKYFDGVSRNVNDISLMRYAEILLIYAEAKAELGTLTESDWNKTIALIRARAGITNTGMPTTLCTYMRDNFYPNISSAAILEIRRERAVELIYEAFRYFDLIRWKAARNLEKEYDGIYVPQMDKLYDLTNDGKPDVAFVTKVPASPVTGVYYLVIDGKSFSLSNGTYGKLICKPGLVKEFPDYKYFKPLPFLQLQLNPNLVQNDGWDHP